jgi:hypothetical protein
MDANYLHDMAGGPGWPRFFIQPTIAILLGLRHGLRDRRMGKPPFLSAVIHDRSHTGALIRDGLRGVVVPLCLALVASFLFQWIIRSHIELIPGVLYAALFVALPYVAARGASNRISSRRRHASS